MNSPYTIKTLMDGLNFPEAPLIDQRGRIWCTELFAGAITCLDANAVRRLSVGTTANGMIEDAQGDFYITDSAENVVRWANAETGEAKPLFDKTNEGETIHRPNDLCFDKLGNLLVTCHAEARTTPDGYVVVQTLAGEVKKVSTKKYFPNGIALDALGTTLYFSETYKHRVWKATWNPNACVIEHEVPWVDVGGPIGPDGMCLDCQGNVYVTVFDQSKIEVISPEGTIIETIRLPYARPTSCAFDTSGQHGLLVTDADQGLLFSVNHAAEGLPPFRRS
ncbi:SMP-30/gluconolactonase/LRE family protein [Tunicatimonas pelagia]|uniref:SMP-30/gluconolactonase/LRE family protein n=1 Tax=Tunicatimonas pelagia TaxID=931531 RepID=UPI002665E228|nr:SMP-30/gluconolactonase/LRE family protein [Tunicatimonas pelagia]WKN42778.1 SMP-30/gluconolactonase/LRE family protein [Tunicatimonas pelagia]